MRILIVEDTQPIVTAVRSMLESRKFAVDVAGDGETGLDYLLRGTYDAAIVDIGLPRRDGFDVALRVRAAGIQTPILMLTARDAVEDRVRGLDVGADDYLVKPFAEQELIARLNALLRRAPYPISSVLEAGLLRIDLLARSARFDGVDIVLGTTEFRVLELLVRNANIAFSRSDLLERIWDYDFDGSPNIVDVYISQLRRKLKEAGAHDIIATVWGVGYKLIA